jgi:signal transduction histidine kinase
MGQRFAATDIEKCDLIVGTPDFDVYRETGIRAVQSTPLVSRSGRVVGMISTHWRHAHEPSEHALRLLDILARQAADLIERKRAQEELGRAKRQLDEQAAHLEQLVCERTAELAATNKQLEALVYSMAHDLRAPLRAMSGFSAMLVEQAGATLGESGQQFAHRISRAAQFMDALLMDLLAFCRISRERLVLSPVNLDSVIKSVLERLAGDVEEKKARVEAAPPPWPTVLADATVLGQVIFNLVENALKFVPSDQPPLARLRAEDRGEVVRMWVEDNGIGISPEAQRQVFEIFTRLHGEKFPGTGIGLAIVQKGVERMGGRVGLESTPGQGSRFWFELRKA